MSSPSVGCPASGTCSRRSPDPFLTQRRFLDADAQAGPPAAPRAVSRLTKCVGDSWLGAAGRYPFGGRSPATAPFGRVAVPGVDWIGWFFGTDRWSQASFFRFQLRRPAAHHAVGLTTARPVWPGTETRRPVDAHASGSVPGRCSTRAGSGGCCVLAAVWTGGERGRSGPLLGAWGGGGRRRRAIRGDHPAIGAARRYP